MVGTIIQTTFVPAKRSQVRSSAGVVEELDGRLPDSPEVNLVLETPSLVKPNISRFEARTKGRQRKMSKARTNDRRAVGPTNPQTGDGWWPIAL